MFHWPVGWYCSYCTAQLVTGTPYLKQNNTSWLGGRLTVFQLPGPPLYFHFHAISMWLTAMGRCYALPFDQWSRFPIFTHTLPGIIQLGFPRTAIITSSLRWCRRWWGDPKSCRGFNKHPPLPPPSSLLFTHIHGWKERDRRRGASLSCVCSWLKRTQLFSRNMLKALRISSMPKNQCERLGNSPELLFLFSMAKDSSIHGWWHRTRLLTDITPVSQGGTPSHFIRASEGSHDATDGTFRQLTSVHLFNLRDSVRNHLGAWSRCKVFLSSTFGENFNSPLIDYNCNLFLMYHRHKSNPNNLEP